MAWALATLQEMGFDAIRAEGVEVPHWERGAASAQIIGPHPQPLHVVSLGGSVGTPEAGIEAPVLVVHGTRDEIIPFSEGEKLYRSASGNAEFLPVEGAGHNDFFAVAGEEYLRLLRARFRSWTGSP